MKNKAYNIFLWIVTATLVYSCKNNTPTSDHVNISKAKLAVNTLSVHDKLSYAIGLDAGREIMSKLTGGEMDTIINRDMVAKGLIDAVYQLESSMQPDSARLVIRDFFMKERQRIMQEELKKYEGNKAESEKFMAENASKPGIKSTASGLQYEVLKQGTGKQPKLNDVIVAHYKGTLLNGAEFDNSYKRNEPLEATVRYGELIDGWVEALQLMKEGSKFRIYVPYDLGYKENNIPAGKDFPGIPPYSTLIFEMELIKVK
jgi:FKBP-type peptidyl-prolyl cis-trans isomerase